MAFRSDRPIGAQCRPGECASIRGERPMFARIAAAVLVVGGSVLIGGAIARLCGSASWGLLAPASGLAALLIACSIAVRLPGDATASSITVAVLIFGSAGLVLRPARAARPKSWEIIAALLAGAAAI